MTERTDLDEMLGVDPTADAAELTRAFRRKLRELHPDTRTAPEPDPETLAAVLAAYQELRQADRRARTEADDKPATEPARRPTADAIPIPVTVRRAAPPARHFLRVGPVIVQPLPPDRRSRGR